MKLLDIEAIQKEYESRTPYQKIGKVLSNRGNLYKVHLSRAMIGSSVKFVTEFSGQSYGEVVSIEGDRCVAMPYEELSGINSETKVYLKELTTLLPMKRSLLGRVVDFQCVPMDDKGPLGPTHEMRDLFGETINPLERVPIKDVFKTGIHAIDSFLTIGKGQRVAIMAGAGVGKSVAMGMIAQRSAAHVNVIALVGERGREVLEFIEKNLGQEGLKKSVVVAATSDQSPLIKIKAAHAAITIAEYFRDQNLDVMLIVDSITRFAMAHREISLSAGEPPGPKGYTPSVYSKLSKLIERAGTKKNSGSITGFFSVFVEGGDIDGPISDAVRAITDGHIILDKKLAEKNQFPAIDVLSSLSRVMNSVVKREHNIVASYLKDLVSVYRENEDLVTMGAYTKGPNEKLDKSLLVYNDILNFLKQERDYREQFSLEELYERMVEIARKSENFDQKNGE